MELRAERPRSVGELAELTGLRRLTETVAAHQETGASGEIAMVYDRAR